MEVLDHDRHVLADDLTGTLLILEMLSPHTCLEDVLVPDRCLRL